MCSKTTVVGKFGFTSLCFLYLTGYLDAEEVEAKREKNTKHRASVIKELIDTEKKYVENLLVMVTVFFDPLTKSSKQVISQDEARGNLIFIYFVVKDILILVGIFSIVEVISNMHTKFLQTLQKRIIVAETEGKEAIVGEIFLELANNLR